MIKAGYFP